MNLAEFHFLRPAWLFLLLPWALLLWRFFQQKVGASFWQKICDPALIPHVVTTLSGTRSRRQFLPFIIGGLLGITALAGPTFERLPQPVFREQAALVILLDLSSSMNAADIAPSRIERARFKIKDILAARRGGQSGLVVFAAHPYVVTPLTDDAQTLDAQLSILVPELMPSQGTDTAAALTQGLELLRQAGYTTGDMLLLTDGITAEQLSEARTILTGSGTRLSVLGFGTAAGAPIPQTGGGFITDRHGGIVISKLDANRLAQLAQTTQGIYQSVTPTSQDVEALVSLFRQRQDHAHATRTDLTSSQWRDLGPWLLIPLLGCAAFAFRPGLTLSLALVAGLAAVPTARAEWWLTPDQAGQRAFNKKQYSTAAQHFADQRWRAAAHYRTENFEDTLTELAHAPDPEDQYNKGNALARLGRFEEAMAAYGAVLKQVPDHADARYNRELLQEIINPPPVDNEAQQKQQQAEREQAEQEGGQNEQGEDGERPGEKGGRDSKMRPPNESDDPARSENDRSEQESSREMSAKQSLEENGSNADTDREETDEQARAEQTENTAPGDPEQALATEQWLRQIPDDPGGLLRRKFQYQYGRRHADQLPSETPW